MVGGVRRENDEYNRATRALRNPGSAVKPFVYAAALEAGWTQVTLVPDRPMEFKDPSQPGGVWRPKNFSGTFLNREITVRYALDLSLNLPAVYTAQAVGLDRVAAKLAQAGFAVRYAVPAIAIGGPPLPLWTWPRPTLPSSTAATGWPPSWSCGWRTRRAGSCTRPPPTGRGSSARRWPTRVGTSSRGTSTTWGRRASPRGPGSRGGWWGEDGHHQRGPGPLVRRGDPGAFRRGLGGAGRQPAPQDGGREPSSSVVNPPIWRDFVAEALKGRPGGDFLPLRGLCPCGWTWRPACRARRGWWSTCPRARCPRGGPRRKAPPCPFPSPPHAPGGRALGGLAWSG